MATRNIGIPHHALCHRSRSVDLGGWALFPIWGEKSCRDGHLPFQFCEIRILRRFCFYVNNAVACLGFEPDDRLCKY